MWRSVGDEIASVTMFHRNDKKLVASVRTAGKNANFWSATENGENNVYNLNLNYNNENANLNSNNKDKANSVRCLRDSELFNQIILGISKKKWKYIP